jgi:hypothetical protein
MFNYLLYLKECLFTPATFFRYQHISPELIQIPWVIQVSLIYSLLGIRHWISKSITVIEIELDFQGLIFVHIGHRFAWCHGNILIAEFDRHENKKDR